MEANQQHGEGMPGQYRDPPTVIREWLDYLRSTDARWPHISDAEVARLTGLSDDIVQVFRSTDRENLGGVRRRHRKRQR